MSEDEILQNREIYDDFLEELTLIENLDLEEVKPREIYELLGLNDRFEGFFYSNSIITLPYQKLNKFYLYGAVMVDFVVKYLLVGGGVSGEEADVKNIDNFFREFKRKYNINEYRRFSFI
jgi:hypothetical protein